MSNDRFKFRVFRKSEGVMVDWLALSQTAFNNGKCSLLYDTLTLFTVSEDHVVMQSTSLKDKNGELIYEGDIVQIGGYCPYVVEYKIESEYRQEIGFNVGDNHEYTILGNIHQNPEVLEAK